MAAQKGSAVLIKVGADGSEVTIGGLRSSSITLNDETVDVTTKDSGNNRELLPQGGIQSVSISGSGVFTDAASEETVRAAFGASSFSRFTFIIPDFGDYAGDFQVTSLELRASTTAKRRTQCHLSHQALATLPPLNRG